MPNVAFRPNTYCIQSLLSRNKHKYIDIAKGYFKDAVSLRSSEQESQTLESYLENKRAEEEKSPEKVLVSKRNVFGVVGRPL